MFFGVGRKLCLFIDHLERSSLGRSHRKSTANSKNMCSCLEVSLCQGTLHVPCGFGLEHLTHACMHAFVEMHMCAFILASILVSQSFGRGLCVFWET